MAALLIGALVVGAPASATAAEIPEYQTLWIDPPRAVWGDTVRVTGWWFEPNATLPIWIGEGSGTLQIGTFRTDSTGRGTGLARIPAQLPEHTPPGFPGDVFEQWSLTLHVTSPATWGQARVSMRDLRGLHFVERHHFADVGPGTYYDHAVTLLEHNGVTTGCSRDHFCPHDTVTRAQAVTFAARLWRGSYGGAAPFPFTDVPRDAYYADAVRWAAEHGITTGVGGSDRFEPDREVTRAELVTMLFRSAGMAPRYDVLPADVPPGSYYAQAAGWALHHGITTGVGGTDRFEPHRTITRAEAAAMLFRMGTRTDATIRGEILL